MIKFTSKGALECTKSRELHTCRMGVLQITNILTLLGLVWESNHPSWWTLLGTQHRLKFVMIIREHLLTLQHWLNFYVWIIVGQCKKSHLDFSIFNIFIQVRGSGGDPRYIFSQILYRIFLIFIQLLSKKMGSGSNS